MVVWTVNGSQLTELNAPDISAYQVGNIFCLDIPAIEEYNNTEVVCSATILGGNDQHSHPVVLKIQGMFCMYEMLYHQ